MDSERDTRAGDRSIGSPPLPEHRERERFEVSSHLTPAGLEYFAEALRFLKCILYLQSTRWFVLDNFEQAELGFRKEFESSSEDNSAANLYDSIGNFAIQLSFDYKLHDQFLSEMLLARAVDNFLKYLTDLLRVVFQSRPETLKSREQESLHYILQFGSMDELIKGLAEKKVEKLSYLGMKNLTQFFEDKLGFVILPDRRDYEWAERLIEERNVVVHNRGVVNSTFRRRLTRSPQCEGERLQLNHARIKNDCYFLSRVVTDIDARSATKWDLPKVSIEEMKGISCIVQQRAKGSTDSSDGTQESSESLV